VASEAVAPAAEVHASRASAAHPGSRSWFDAALGWLVGLPGPTWLAYLGFTLLALAWTTAVGWLAHYVPAGSVTATQSSYAFFLVAPFAFAHVLNRAAARALDRFAPAVDASPVDLAGWRRDLTTIPPRIALLFLVIGAGMDLMSWLSDPVAAQTAGAPIEGLVLRAAGEFVLAGAWAVVIVHIVRQLRLVSRLHERAVQIDLFRPAPLHAFSQLTVRTGIGLALVAGYAIVTSPPELLLTPVSVVFVSFLIVTAAAAFALPLRGIQRRLAAEKERLLDGVNARLETAMGRLDAAVDAGELATMDGHQKALAALTQQRDFIARLRTWPWDPSTFRAFASAIALPIGLWLVTRILERVV